MQNSTFLIEYIDAYIPCGTFSMPIARFQKCKNLDIKAMETVRSQVSTYKLDANLHPSLKTTTLQAKKFSKSKNLIFIFNKISFFKILTA